MSRRYNAVITAIRDEQDRLQLVAQFAQGESVSGSNFAMLLGMFELWDGIDPRLQEKIREKLNFVWRDGGALFDTRYGPQSPADEILTVKVGIIAAELSNAIDRKYLPALEAREEAMPMSEAA